MIREKDGSAGAGNMPGDPRSASGTPRDNAADIRAQERKSMSGQGKLVYREKKRWGFLGLPFTFTTYLLYENDIQINQLLGYADALISDYSSVAVDYLVLDRPVAFTLDDMETYGNERGFFWDDVKQWLPGEDIYTFEDFVSFIEDVMADRDNGKKKRDSISRLMQKYRDDKNSERVLKALNII